MKYRYPQGSVDISTDSSFFSKIGVAVSGLSGTKLFVGLSGLAFIWLLVSRLIYSRYSI